MLLKEPIKFLISIALPQLAGFFGSYFTIDAIDGWYRTINKPSFNPPDYVFGPVWTALYLMMGIALYLVWKEGASVPRVKFAMGIFFVQLAFNSLWSLVFFGGENPGGAVFVIFILWLLILANIFAFARISKVAAYLLVPYLLWVSFATVLNFQIWMLN